MVRHDAPILLSRWLARLEREGTRIAKLLSPAERQSLCERILDELLASLASGATNQSAEFARLRSTLADTSASFAERGFSPSETAIFVFSLKQVFAEIDAERPAAEQDGAGLWAISNLVDELGLWTFETFTLTRERLIKSQAEAIADLATPVIQVWEGIVALPLVGSIDSMRAKDIMEKLLEAVVKFEADIVIIDITGVPVVDTQVANRLMRTVESVRLLGTKSIITGINPIIAQTLVQLGVDLAQLTTKASLRSGLQQAFRELKLRVVSAEAKH